jgi:aspartyl-tRNA(Asn)/glutamyl-tRNA(Gln) amidotransferase subunit B
MQKGQMRCDANISLRPLGDEKYYPKTEIKNLNSFKAVEDALNYEIERQTDLWEKGEVNSTTSTRGWDEKRGVTILQREKEESHDYRYFPEPDLPIVESATLPFQIDDLKKELAELPLAKQDRWIRDYQILKSEAKILSSNKSLADYADQILSNAQKWPEENREKGAKLSINWLINRFWPLVDQADPRKTFEKISAQKFYNFINLLLRNSFSSTVAQKILEETVMTGEEPELIMKRSGLDESLDDAGLDDLISKITQQNAKVVEDYHKGKESALQFLVGQIMRETRGRVNPQKALLRLKELIK